MLAQPLRSSLACLTLLAVATGVHAAEWLGEWPFRTAITIDSQGIDADLTNFPVLVRLTPQNFDFALAAPDGRDIRFAGPDGATLLAFERESHDSAMQTAAYWVRLPRVSASTDTTFYLYCGKLGAADGAAPAAVWDATHVAVWHLQQTNGVTQADATAAGNTLTIGPAGLDGGGVPITDCDSTTGWSATGTGSSLAVDTATSHTAGGSTRSIKLTIASTAAGQTNILVYQPDAPLALGNRRLDFFVSTDKNFGSGFIQARVYLYDTGGNYRSHDLATGISFSDSTRGYGIGTGGTTGGTDPDVNAIARIEWRFISADDTPYAFRVDSLTASGALEEGTPGTIVAGVTLSGNNNHLVSSPLSIDTTDGLSISAWVRPHDAQVYWPHLMPVVAMGGPNWYPYDSAYLAYFNDGRVGGSSSASKSQYPNGTSISGNAPGLTVGEWHHVGAVYHYDAEASNTTMKIYVDGSLKVDSATTGRALRSQLAKVLCVGAINHDAYPANPPRQHFHGELDEVRVASVARSGAWMKASHLSQMADGALLRVAGTESHAAWLPRWKRRRRITIEPGAVAADLAHFPVLVRLTADNFDFSQAAPDGADIRFLSGDGNRFLAYERESHDAARQTATYWVRLPLVSSSEATTFYLYYSGRSGAVDGANPAAVWDEAHAAVWHLRQTNGVTQADSTAAGVSLTVGPVGLDRGDVPLSDCGSTTDWSVTGNDISLAVDTVTRDTIAGSPSSLKATVAVTAVGQANTLVYDPAEPLVLGNRRLNFYLYVNKNSSTGFSSIRVYLYDADGNYRYHDFAKGSGTDRTKGFSIAAGGKTGGTDPDVNAIDRIEWVLVSANDTPYALTLDSLGANGALDEGVPGAIDQAVSFTGQDHFLMTAPVTIDTTNGLTFSAWVRPRDYDVYSSRSYLGIVDTGGGNTAPYYQTLLGYWKLQKICGTASMNSIYDVYPNGVSLTGQGAGLTTGVWHHVASVFHYDHAAVTTSMRLYVDGVLKLDASKAGCALRPVLNKYICVGAVPWSPYPSYDPAYNFSGELDEVRISNVARSDAWVAASFQNQQAGSTLLTVGHIEPPPGTLLFLR